MNSQTAELVTDDLPPPRIRENPTSDLLNPVVLRYSCTIIIEYAIEPGDSVRITWAGAEGAGSYTSDPFSVGVLRPLAVGIGGVPLVIFNQGKTVKLSYTVVRGASAPVTSKPLILYVLPVMQSDLPRPFITQASDLGDGSVLDVNALTEFTLRINAWPLLTEGQYFWLRLRGTNADDSAFDELYWSAPGNLVDQEFSKGFYARNYSANLLTGLKDRSLLTLEFMAGLEGSQDVAIAQRFAHRNYIVRTGAPVILLVKDPLGQDIADGRDTEHSSVTVEGSASMDGEVEIFDGQDSQGTARVDRGNWKYQVTGLTEGPHVFTAQALYGNRDVSNPWSINVILQNRRLSIKEAPDNVNLDPLVASQYLTAVLNMLELEPEDLITVTWKAAPGTPAAGSQTTSAVLAGSNRPIEIALRVSLVAFSLGKGVEVTFTYTRGASAPVTSQPFLLNVLTIPAAKFIAPVITEANGTAVLDLKDVTDGATLQFGCWPHIAVGQRIWLDLEGRNASGASHNLSMWTGNNNAVHRSWVLNGYSVMVLYSYLQNLGDGSTLSIRFRVNMDQVADSQTAVVFDTREYTVRA